MDDKLNYLSVQRREPWALAEFTRVGELIVQEELAEEIAANPEAATALKSDASMRARRERVSYALMRKLNAEHCDRCDQHGAERMAREDHNEPQRQRAMAEGRRRDAEHHARVNRGDHITDPAQRRLVGLPPLEEGNQS
jgi:hypothetical protein